MKELLYADPMPLDAMRNRGADIRDTVWKIEQNAKKYRAAFKRHFKYIAALEKRVEALERTNAKLREAFYDFSSRNGSQDDFAVTLAEEIADTF